MFQDVLAVCVISGIPILFVGMIAANVMVFKMQALLNTELAKDDRTSPWLVIGKGAAVQKPVEKYRAKYGDGSLYRGLRLSYWLCGIGGVLSIGGGLIAKVMK